MDRLTTADFNEAVRIRNRPPPGCSKSVTTEQKICARLRRLQKNPGELQKSHKNGFRSAKLPGGARGWACQAPKLVDFRLLLLRLNHAAVAVRSRCQKATLARVMAPVHSPSRERGRD